MRLFNRLDDARIPSSIRARYGVLVTKLLKEYLFENERRAIFDELEELRAQAGKAVQR